MQILGAVDYPHHTRADLLADGLAADQRTASRQVCKISKKLVERCDVTVSGLACTI